MRTLIKKKKKSNERGGQSRKDATSVGNESFSRTFISPVNSGFLTDLFEAGHELSALEPKQPHSTLSAVLTDIW